MGVGRSLAGIGAAGAILWALSGVSANAASNESSFSQMNYDTARENFSFLSMFDNTSFGGFIREQWPMVGGTLAASTALWTTGSGALGSITLLAGIAWAIYNHSQREFSNQFSTATGASHDGAYGVRLTADQLRDRALSNARGVITDIDGGTAALDAQVAGDQNLIINGSQVHDADQPGDPANAQELTHEVE